MDKLITLTSIAKYGVKALRPGFTPPSLPIRSSRAKKVEQKTFALSQVMLSTE